MPGPGPSSQAIAKAAASGDAQRGPVGFPLPLPITVLVTRGGTPESGAAVTWTANGAGASVSATTTATGSDGTTSVEWTLGQTAGSQTVRAALSSGGSVTFAAVADPGGAAQLGAASGEGQTGAVSSSLPEMVVVKVTDQYGNGVSGSTVEWLVTGGGGSTNPSAGQTDQQGLASTAWSLGPAEGANTLQATVDGLTGSPVTFHASGVLVAPAPFDIAIEVRNNAFFPVVDTVAVGGTVTWNWVGSGHNVTSVLTPAFSPASATENTGFTFGPITFNVAGTYRYICTIHGFVNGQTTSGMAGTIVVR